MRRPLPGAPRRGRSSCALLVPLVLFGPAGDVVATTAVTSRPTPCGSTSTADALTSKSCADACGAPITGQSLCVYRTRAPSSCTVDCVPIVAAATIWTVQWLEDQPNGRAAVVVTSAASSDETPSIVVINESVTRIDDQLALPTSLMQLSLTGPTTSLLMEFSLSDALRSSFASLRYLNLTKVNVSEWKTLPAMPSLRNLSLNDVALDWWPITSSLNTLDALSLDNNRLTDLAANPLALPSSLRSLSLRSTGITKLPESILSVTLLRELFLDGNNISENATAVLPRSLRTLSVRECALSRFPDQVASLPDVIPASVRELRLAGCGIAAFSIIPVKNSALRILDLSSNPLPDVGDELSKQLSALSNLTSLDLSATNRLRVPDAIAAMTQLTHLSLASNAIDTANAAVLPLSLQHLNVAYNTKPQSLSFPPALLSLNVSHCGLVSLAAVQPLSNLQSLDASGNALASDDVTLRVLPPSLTFLNLSANGLTIFPDAIFGLSSLAHLDLRGNPIPSGAVQTLSSSQVAFLRSLASLYVDAAVFETQNCGPSIVTIAFGYTVCVVAAPSTTSQNDDPAADAAAAKARARVNRNLTIIAGTIGTALVLVTLTSLVLRRKRNRSRTRARTRARTLHGSKLLQAAAGDASIGDGAWPTELASDRGMTDAEWRALQMWSFWDDEAILQLRLPWDLVRDRQVIGSGQYSVLWLARVATQPVILKALQPTAHRSDGTTDEGAVAAVAALMREIQVLRCVRHPQIVRLVGVTWLNAPTDVQLAIEDMANGDLRGYLELTQPPAPPARWRSDGFAMRVALSVADALVFLHARGVAHNDVRSRNVVLDDDCHAKLTGFGRHVFVAPVETHNDDDDDDKGKADKRVDRLADAVARAVATAAERDQHVPSPRVDQTFLLEAGRWMAPEVLRRHLRGRHRRRGSATTTTATTTATTAASPAADVYAFGVLLLELDAFEIPFERVDVDEDDWRPLEDATSNNDNDDELDRRPRPHHYATTTAAARPHAASDGRFSSMPSGHNSLLGGGATLLQTQHDIMDDGTTLPLPPTLHATEERRELALLRRLADGVLPMEPTPSCHAGIKDVIRQCLALRPEHRPSIRSVRDALRAVAGQRHRSSTGGSSSSAIANSNSNTTRSIDSSQRSLLSLSGRGGGGGGRTNVSAATQTVDEDCALVDGSSSAESDATTTTSFFVMPQSPSRRPPV